MYGGLCEQVNVPFDPADSPKVLTFQVASRRPSVYFKGDKVTPRFQVAGNVIFHGCLGILAIPDFCAVHVQVASRFYRTDM